MLQENKKQSRKWPRGQRFVPTAAGVAAEAAYRAAILRTRGEAGRASFDAARTDWASQIGLVAEDSVILGEICAGAKSIADLCTILESYGSHRDVAVSSVNRLYDAGLVIESEAAAAVARLDHSRAS